jgi:flagellar biosynthetic protein FliQ
MPIGQVGDILHETVYMILKLSTPLLLAALVVGVVVSLIQALIQVQEQTLTFVPKLFAVFVCLIFFASLMASSLINFTQRLFNLIPQMM